MIFKTNKTCYIRTFGCQMNEHDSGKMSILLGHLGFSRATNPKEADLILFNTCTIREKAYHKAISEIGRSLIYKQRRPDVIIGVCGCVAQQEGLKLTERFGHIDLIFGPDQIGRLPELLTPSPLVVCPPARREKSRGEGEIRTALDLVNTQKDYNFLDIVPPRVQSGHSFVTATKGCNCSCSYCIVPSVRGKEVSRSRDDIITEIKELVERGVKEVTLLGQNVTSYNAGGLTLAGLIRKISVETNILRIRFTSPHPKDVDDALITEYAGNSKLCPHIHLPAQSGSNAILKKMRRGYTREKYLSIVEKLRQARHNISITSDFIVGFCGEKDSDFEDTLNLLQEVLFDSIFAFKYSPRPTTYAPSQYKDNIPKNVKEARLDQLLSLQRKITRTKNEKLIGQVGDILVSGPDRKNSGLLMGRLPDNRIVNFAGNDTLIGSIISVRITKAFANSLKGEISA